MADFDYSEFSWDDAEQGKLIPEQILKLVTHVCKAEDAQQAKRLLVEQFSHMPDEKMLNYINLNPAKLLGVAIHSRQEIPYGAELERLILDSEYTYMMDHALSAEAEQKLVAMSSGYGECKRDDYGEPLEAKCRKLSYYVGRFSSIRLLRLLLKQAENAENPAKEKLWALERAVHYLPDNVVAQKLLSDVDLQLDILELQNKKVSKWLLSKFTFKNYPAPEIIQQLIKTDSVDLLRFLMAFSTVGTEMPEVCKAYPQLKTEVFLAELTRLAAFFVGITTISYVVGDIIEGKNTAGIFRYIENYTGHKLTDTMEAICVRLYLAVDVKKARKKCYYDALNFCKAHSNVVEIAFFESMLHRMEDF